MAAAKKDVEADLNAFEAPTAAEIGADPASIPGRRPGSEINQLDAAIAASAEDILVAAQQDLKPEPAPEAAPAAATPATKPDPTPAPAVAAPVAAPVAPAVHAAPVEPAKPAAAKPRQAAVAASLPAARPAFEMAGIGSKLSGALVPLAVMHEKLGESTRQTIGYCAVLTLFMSLCVWGKVIAFPAKSEAEPATEVAALYDETTPAHGVTAPPKHVEKAAEGEGHAQAKKPDAHAQPKPEKKPPASHGASGGHAEKKTSGPPKKAGAHGGH